MKLKTFFNPRVVSLIAEGRTLVDAYRVYLAQAGGFVELVAAEQAAKVVATEPTAGAVKFGSGQELKQSLHVVGAGALCPKG